jgi:hypothetical protein
MPRRHGDLHIGESFRFWTISSLRRKFNKSRSEMRPSSQRPRHWGYILPLAEVLRSIADHSLKIWLLCKINNYIYNLGWKGLSNNLLWLKWQQPIDTTDNSPAGKIITDSLPRIDLAGIQVSGLCCFFCCLQCNGKLFLRKHQLFWRSRVFCRSSYSPPTMTVSVLAWNFRLQVHWVRSHPRSSPLFSRCVNRQYRMK